MRSVCPPTGAQGFLAASVVGMLFLVAAAAQAEDVLLACGSSRPTSHILLRPDQGQAELIDRDPVVIGLLTVEDNLYRMVFPETEKTHEIRIKVFRYTGKYEWEWGDPPNNGWHHTGTCAVSEAVRKF